MIGFWVDTRSLLQISDLRIMAMKCPCLGLISKETNYENTNLSFNNTMQFSRHRYKTVSKNKSLMHEIKMAVIFYHIMAL